MVVFPGKQIYCNITTTHSLFCPCSINKQTNKNSTHLDGKAWVLIPKIKTKYRQHIGSMQIQYVYKYIVSSYLQGYLSVQILMIAAKVVEIADIEMSAIQNIMEVEYQ